jgi:hypothetical protein
MLKKIYNYILGYTEKDCVICKKKVCISTNHISIKTNNNIVCSKECMDKYVTLIVK